MPAVCRLNIIPSITAFPNFLGPLEVSQGMPEGHPEGAGQDGFIVLGKFRAGRGTALDHRLCPS